MAEKFKIRKGDEVMVVSGSHKGGKGTVKEVFRQEQRVLVEGLNMVKRHTRPTQASPGGIVQKEAPLHISNVAHIDPKDGKPTRIRYEIKDGAKLRVAKRSGEPIDKPSAAKKPKKAKKRA